MGILHLAGLGRSPGALTCGLSYLQNRHTQRTNMLGEIVDEVVVFTSEEVATGKLRTYPPEVWLNPYGTAGRSRQHWKEAPVLEVIERFFESVLEHAHLHVCIVDINSFQDCFRAVAQTIHRFHRRGETGRHIQINLTGGTNPLNAALFQAALLSGTVAKFYYTFTTQTAFLQPIAASDPLRFRYQEIPVLATQSRIDVNLHLLLAEMDRSGSAWIHEKELWSRLAGCLQDTDEIGFRRDYLNVLDGQYIEQQGERRPDGKDTRTGNVRLTELGRQLLTALASPWFRALQRDSTAARHSEAELTHGLSLERRWPRP